MTAKAQESELGLSPFKLGMLLNEFKHLQVPFEEDLKHEFKQNKIKLKFSKLDVACNIDKRHKKEKRYASISTDSDYHITNELYCWHYGSVNFKFYRLNPPFAHFGSWVQIADQYREKDQSSKIVKKAPELLKVSFYFGDKDDEVHFLKRISIEFYSDQAEAILEWLRINFGYPRVSRQTVELQSGKEIDTFTALWNSDNARIVMNKHSEQLIDNRGSISFTLNH